MQRRPNMHLLDLSAHPPSTRSLSNSTQNSPKLLTSLLQGFIKPECTSTPSQANPPTWKAMAPSVLTYAYGTIYHCLPCRCLIVSQVYGVPSHCVSGDLWGVPTTPSPTFVWGTCLS